MPKHSWGCSELMAMAAYFLQRKCVVLSYGTTSQLLWECSIDRPCTTSRGGEVQETGQQVPSQLDECIAVIRSAKTVDAQLPFILHF